MNKYKLEALKLLRQKINGEIIIIYQKIADRCNYSLIQIKRLSKEIEKKDIEDLLARGLTGKNSNNSAPNESQLCYCYAFKLMFIKNGLPEVIYVDRASILCDSKEGQRT